ncbi:MAG: hypothetical protein VYE64_04890 [Planctomycetota bacterium]|nr:hypothetical protein [Planctomycetota bacterium]
MEIRFLNFRFLRYGLCGLLGLLLLAGLLICLIGQSQQHVGWLEREGVVARQDSPEPLGPDSLYARIKNKNPLFRGNDLFCVTSPEIQTDHEILGQSWDTEEGRGRVHLSLENRLGNGETLPVTYRLSVRWEKFIPFMISLLMAGLAIMFWVKIVFAARLVCLLLVAGLAVWNLFHFGWVYGDEYFILSSTVQGNLLHSTVWPETGRFWPLGLVDLNLLIPFGDSPFVYSLELSILFLLAIAAIYWGIRRTAGSNMACLLVIAFLLLPQVLRVYSVCIYAEPRLVLLLALFFILYYRADETGNKTYLVSSCMIASLATYYKEPIFGLFMVFSLTQLLFGYSRLSRAQRWANFFLIGNGAVFLSLYGWFCANSQNYVDGINDGSTSTLDILGNYLLNPLLAFSLVCGLCRAYEILFQGDRRFLKYDGALFSGLAYAVAFALLKLYGSYYLIPAYVCLMFSFSGYLADLQKRVTDQHRSRENHPDQEHRLTRWAYITDPKTRLATFLVVIIFSAAINLPKFINELGAIPRERQVTRQITALFLELESRGFQICTYIPEEMSTHSEGIQKCRRTVLNIFHFNSQGGHKIDPDRNWLLADSPILELSGDTSENSTSKMIVIHDMAYSIDGLNNQPNIQGQMEMIESIPQVMGAKLFAQPEFHGQIRKMANRRATANY